MTILAQQIRLHLEAFECLAAAKSNYNWGQSTALLKTIENRARAEAYQHASALLCQGDDLWAQRTADRIRTNYAHANHERAIAVLDTRGAEIADKVAITMRQEDERIEAARARRTRS